MKFYDKGFENNFEELIVQYPRFYRDVFEMVEILKAHGRIADDLEANIERTYFNCFIDLADEATIAKLEKFLDIRLNKSRTLEERRRLVKSYFAGFGKISASMLEEMIGSYTGTAVECRFEPFDDERNNMLYINFERGTEPSLYMSDIILLLEKKLPAHIKWQAAVSYRYPIGVGRRRQNYTHYYEFCGTKPQTVLIAAIHGIEAATEADISAVRVGYRQSSETDLQAQAGTTPNTSTLAHISVTEMAAGVNTDMVTATYKSSSEGGLMPEAGVAPGVATVGHFDEISAAAEVGATPCGVNYVPCGTAYTSQ